MVVKNEKSFNSISIVFGSCFSLTACGDGAVKSKTFSGEDGIQITFTEDFVQKNDGINENVSHNNNVYSFTASKKMSLENEEISFVALKFNFDTLPDDIQEIGVENIDEEWFAELLTRGFHGCSVVNDTENEIVYYIISGMEYGFTRVIKADDAFWSCRFESAAYSSRDDFASACIPWAKTITIG